MKDTSATTFRRAVHSHRLSHKYSQITLRCHDDAGGQADDDLTDIPSDALAEAKAAAWAIIDRYRREAADR